jgi:ribonuclease HI
MNKIIVFTDGSSLGNPGPGGWAAIVGSPKGKIIELGGRVANTTNNRMELQAAIESLKHIGDTRGDVVIHTDSSYVIQGITKWVKSWAKNNWRTATKAEVLNKDLWKELLALLEKREELGNITWKHIAGHSGIPGNERVDVIATISAQGKHINLFNGPRGNYTIDLKIVAPTHLKKEIREHRKKRSGQKAYSYVSMINGEIKIHTTWAECEARVKGKNAKFKKALSAEDEQEIIKSFKE